MLTFWTPTDGLPFNRRFFAQCRNYSANCAWDQIGRRKGWAKRRNDLWGEVGAEGFSSNERHILEVILVTALGWSFPHTRIMERTVDEAEYVLAILQRMRTEVSANPLLFDLDAQQRIEQAIVSVQNVLRSARFQCSVGEEIKAA